VELKACYGGGLLRGTPDHAPALTGSHRFAGNGRDLIGSGRRTPARRSPQSFSASLIKAPSSRASGVFVYRAAA
jgi:hypothetical protein